ncbi:MAG: homoserine O-acetyltransferase [Clostridiales bacterium]|jgi:homoserine O-acetyltransferase|nr:homoserine O-acetyltransferase [Clostridiales bacterium]
MNGQPDIEYFRGDWPAQKTYTFAYPPALFRLESGKSLGPVTVAYETYGTLAPDGKNAIYIPHALTGTAHAGTFTDRPEQEQGWWHGLIGPGKVFDTERYFIVCSNVLGGCYGTTGPASLNPDTGVPFAMDFPVITIRDMVRGQKYLLEHLGVKRLVTVAGGSMGGMQALEWAVTFPEMVDSVIAIAASERLTPLAIAYNQAGRKAIMNDAEWCRGNYYGRTYPVGGLALARMIGTITYKSKETFEERFGRKLAGKEHDVYNFFQDFEVERYLNYQGSKLVKRFDANSYLYLTKAMDLHDLSRGYPSPAEVLRRIVGPVLLVGISSDLLYPPGEIRGLAVELRRCGVETDYRELQSTFGHDAFLIEYDQLATHIDEFLKKRA